MARRLAACGVLGAKHVWLGLEIERDQLHVLIERRSDERADRCHRRSLSGSVHVGGRYVRRAVGGSLASAHRSSPEEPQLVLYTVSKPKDDKRAVLHVFDAKNDPVNLSSRAVKRVKWAANVPSSILGKEYDGANRACCALRDALDPSKKSLGNNGINFKVFMCLNSEGKAVTVKEVLDKKQLGKYLK